MSVSPYPPPPFSGANELLHEKGVFSMTRDVEPGAKLIFCAFWPVAWGGLQSSLSLSFLPHWSRGGKWRVRSALLVPQGLRVRPRGEGGIPTAGQVLSNGREQEGPFLS